MFSFLFFNFLFKGFKPPVHEDLILFQFCPVSLPATTKQFIFQKRGLFFSSFFCFYFDNKLGKKKNNIIDPYGNTYVVIISVLASHTTCFIGK